MDVLTSEEGEVLVRTARRALEARLSGGEPPQPTNLSPSLEQQRGVFITLLDHSNGDVLRGCIGLPFPTRSLLEQVQVAAVEAATADHRFEPLELDELKNRIIVEATVLSAMEPIQVQRPLDLRENIVVGRDGLMIECMGSHGLLLPQVAVDEGFDSEEFLCNCCMKADLPPDAWLTGELRVSRFQGQTFSEEEPNGGVFERSLGPRVRD